MFEVFKLNDRVSANNDVEPEDARKLKRVLMRLDFLEAPGLGEVALPPKPGTSARKTSSSPPPIRKSFIDKWKKRGFGGPRGELSIPILRHHLDRIENVIDDNPARFNVVDNPALIPRRHYGRLRTQVALRYKGSQRS